MIREATIHDATALVDLGHELLNESQDTARFSDKRARQTILRYITDKNKIIFIDQDGRGAILAHISQFDFSDETYAFEQYWFVKQESRGGPTALRLYKAFEDWAKKKGVTDIRFGIGTGVNLAATEKLLKQLGHTKIGGFYKKEL